MRILITGAGGYIGSNAAEYFLRCGFAVTGTVHEKVSARFASSGAESRQLDLYEPETIRALFQEHYDYIIHIAALASDTGREALFKRANFEAVKELALLAMQHRVKRFVYLSTADVYGLHDFHGETEDELDFDWSVKNPYPKYKIMSEDWLRRNLPADKFSCVRPCVVWGNGDTTITPRALKFLQSSPWVIHFGRWRGHNRWPLAHVENVCRSLHAAMLLGEAGGRGVTVLDSKYTTLSGYYRELSGKYFPDKPFREITLPVWSVRLPAWISSRFSGTRPLFDPTLYSLATITHNLDFSNARMLCWLNKSGLTEYTG